MSTYMKNQLAAIVHEYEHMPHGVLTLDEFARVWINLHAFEFRTIYALVHPDEVSA